MWQRPAFRSVPIAIALFGIAVGLSACGAARSTLPPKPKGPQGFVPLTRLAGDPEVYAQAQVTSIGIVRRRGAHHFLLVGPGVKIKIALDPASLASPLVGQRVRATGIFTVSFQAGYEILLSSLSRA